MSKFRYLKYICQQDERKHMIDFKKSIHAEMKRHKISIPKMARKIGCNHQTLYNFFAGRTALNSDFLEDILHGLDGKLTFKKGQTSG